MNKAIQAKHVPEDVILAALNAQPGRWMTHWPFVGDDPAKPWSLLTAAPALAAFPEKVLLAKLDAMKRRGVIEGCGCGCRGDWHVQDPAAP